MAGEQGRVEAEREEGAERQAGRRRDPGAGEAADEDRAERRDATREHEEGQAREPGPVILALDGVSALSDRGLRCLSDVHLEVRSGEILGLAGVAGNGQSELAEVISVTVDRWDGKEAAERIELHVGRDLQFIRINGTIVGALAGVGIHALSQVAG